MDKLFSPSPCQGLEVPVVVSDYFSNNDPRSCDQAAFKEWINMAVAQPEDYAARYTRDRRFE